MSISELLGTAPSPGHLRLKELIAAARERPPRTFEFTMTVGDRSAEVVLTELRGERWADLSPLMPRHRHPFDAATGVNTDAFMKEFPVDLITVGGEHPSTEEWHHLVELLDAPTREDILTGLWWLHWGAPEQEEREILARKEATDG